MTFRWIPVVLTVTAALLAASCSDPGRGDPEAIRPIPTTTPVTTSSTTATTLATTTSSSSSTTSTTTTLPVDPEAATKQEIADVVVKAWEAYIEASNFPVQPDLPALELYYTPALAEETKSELENLISEGLAYRPSQRDIESISVLDIEMVSNSEAAVVTCLVSDAIEFRPATNEVTNDSTSAILRSYIVARNGDRWKVSAYQLIQRFEGAESCDQ